MNRVAWTTDIHLEFLGDSAAIGRFCQSIADTDPDTVLIGGDIAVAPSIGKSLLLLEKYLQRPIYFVLGNHDFYNGSISQVRSAVTRLTRQSPWLRWLSISGIIELTPNTGLIGHDGLADGRLGNSVRSRVVLNDYLLIRELKGLPKSERFAKLHSLGDKSARYFKSHLPSAVTRFRNLLLLTHVPPFKEACWHEGQISDDEFLPHFTCDAVGNVLIEIMQNHPECNLTVLCGHTHSPGETTILPNLHVKTGGAAYGSPRLQELIIVD